MQRRELNAPKTPAGRDLLFTGHRSKRCHAYTLHQPGQVGLARKRQSCRGFRSPMPSDPLKLGGAAARRWHVVRQRSEATDHSAGSCQHRRIAPHSRGDHGRSEAREVR